MDCCGIWTGVENLDVGDGNQGDIYAAEKSVGDVLLRANFGIVPPYPGTITGARRRAPASRPPAILHHDE